MEENKELDDIIEETKSDKRPFFSIIIPCYNTPLDYMKALLFSIANGGCSDELEVIIADGRSTDTSYQEEVKKFEEESGILVKIVTMVDKNEDGIELVNCPGNTREYGVKNATGEWITFIDHDDIFDGDVFTKVKNAIEENNEQYLVCSNILQIDPYTNEIIQEIRYSTNWMHGKFYNRRNLWEDYNFHFKKNLVSNEDIYISNKLHCILHNLGKEQVLWLPDYTYIWRAWMDSTSHKKYSDELSYMEYYFYDYISATYDIHNEEYDKLVSNGIKLSDEDKKFYTEMQVDALLFQYFYLQSFKYSNPTWLKEYEDTVKNNIKKFYEKYNVDVDYFYNAVRKELDNDDIREGGFITKIWYNSVRYSVTISCGNFIETDSFIDFIQNL